MPRRSERIPLPAESAGTERFLTVFRYGTQGRRPKVYLQAALHADEIPGLLVLHHLCARLDEAEERGEIAGDITVVPSANPIGLAQHVAGRHLGRYDLPSGINFNRGYADLTDRVADRVADSLTDDGEANTAKIRAAIDRVLQETTPATAFQHLQHTLRTLATGSDIALDLHCDFEALNYFFLGTRLWPGAADLAADIGAEAVLLAVESGGNPFDEAHSVPWARLADRFPDKPIPQACLSATLELRGMSDVSDDLARTDAANLYRFLQRRGAIAGDPGPLPPAKCDATPLKAADSIKAPCGGVVTYRKQVGDPVAVGEVIAEIVDPIAADAAAARTPVASRAGGRLYSRCRDKLVHPGQTIANVAGTEPLAHRSGDLIED